MLVCWPPPISSASPLMSSLWNKLKGTKDSTVKVPPHSAPALATVVDKVMRAHLAEMSPKHLVAQCIQFIRSHGGATIKDLFTASPDNTLVNEVYAAFDSGNARRLTSFSNLSPCDAIAIIILFFRRLPEPILTHALYKPFLSAHQQSHPIKQIQELSSCISNLPQVNIGIADTLFEFLAEVSSCPGTKYTSTYLGTMFGPFLLFPEVIKSQTPAQVAAVNTIIKELIDNFEYFFRGGPMTIPPVASHHAPAFLASGIDISELAMDLASTVITSEMTATMVLPVPSPRPAGSETGSEPSTVRKAPSRPRMQLGTVAKASTAFSTPKSHTANTVTSEKPTPVTSEKILQPPPAPVIQKPVEKEQPIVPKQQPHYEESEAGSIPAVNSTEMQEAQLLISELTAQVETLRNEVENREKDLDEASDMITELEDRLAAEEERKLELQKSLDELMAWVSSAKIELGKKTEENNKIKRELALLKDARGLDPSSELDVDSADRNARVENLMGQVTALQKQLSTVLKSREEALTKASKEKEELEGRVKQLEYVLTNEKGADFTDLASKMESLRSRDERNKIEIDTLKQQLSIALKQCENERKNLERERAFRTDNEKGRRMYEDRIRELEEEVVEERDARLEDERLLRGEITVATETIAALKDQMRRMERSLAAAPPQEVVGEVSHLKVANEKMSTQVKALFSRLQEAESHRDLMVERVKRLEQEFPTNDRDLVEMSERLAQLNTEKQALLQELEVYHNFARNMARRFKEK